MAWRFNRRSHPAMTLPNDVALHYSLSVRGPVANGGEGGEERRERVLLD